MSARARQARRGWRNRGVAIVELGCREAARVARGGAFRRRSRTRGTGDPGARHRIGQGRSVSPAHALHLDDTWMLCGPDKASLRFGGRMGFRERLVSLERLLDDVGYRSRSSLRTAYTRGWLRRTLVDILAGDGEPSSECPLYTISFSVKGLDLGIGKVESEYRNTDTILIPLFKCLRLSLQKFAYLGKLKSFSAGGMLPIFLFPSVDE